MAGLIINGERTTGEDVRAANVTAAMAIGNIVKTSLGPVGLDKMLVDAVGDVTITNDGATILKQLDVEHPAAKVLVELADLQDQEVGDGTTSVVIIASELLRRANDLVKNHVHPTSVISGYRLALKEAVKYIKQHLVVPVDQLGRENLINAAKTCMSSKILGPESDFFAEMAVNAVTSVRLEVERGGDAASSSGSGPGSASGSGSGGGSGSGSGGSGGDGAGGSGGSAGDGSGSSGSGGSASDGSGSGSGSGGSGSGSGGSGSGSAGSGGGAGGRRAKYPISNIHILKCHGRSALESELVPGFALNCTRVSHSMPSNVPEARIALLDFGLQRHKMQMGVQVVVNDAAQVDQISQREMDITKEKIERILAAGANVVLTTKGIDDLCSKYFVEAGVMAVRRVKKEDLRRIAKATGGTVVVTMADMEGNETFEENWLGAAERVSEERVGDGQLIYFRGTATHRATTVVLRGANEYMLDEMDRALHDALCVVKRMLESNTLVAGGGAVEAALSIYLENFATSLGSREQLAVAEFAEALLVIPRTLSVNAAQDATDLVAQLRMHHNTSQVTDDNAELRFSGLDLLAGNVRNNLEAGVVEPAISKIKSLRFATEAACSILRIDDMIKLNPDEDPNAQRGGHPGHMH